MSRNFTIASNDELRAQFPELMAELQAQIETGGGCQVNVQPLDLHTDEQRRRLNAMCGDLQKQVRLSEDRRFLHVTECPFGEKLSKDDWRGMFMAIIHGMRSVPNPEGQGFIVLSRSSQRLSKKRFADAITLITAFGNERRVVWSDPKWLAYFHDLQQQRAAA